MTEVAPMHQTNESQRINRLSVPRDDDPKSDTPDKAKHGALKGQARLNQLRLLRVEVQELRNVLHRLSTGQTTLEAHRAYFARTRTQIDELIESLQQKHDDTIRHVINDWEQICDVPIFKDELAEQAAHAEQENQQPPQLPQQVLQLQQLDILCRSMIFWIGLLTIPERLNEWLSTSKLGYAIPFHMVFEDEMPDAEDRQKLLELLAWSPQVVPQGTIDPTSGLVYRKADLLIERIGVWLGIAAGIGLATLIASTLIVWFPLPAQGMPLKNALVGWVALLIGIVVHMAVATTKRMREQGGAATVLPINWVVLMIESQLGGILLKLLMALIGFTALVYSGITEPNTFVFNALLVGYSLDSVVELVSGAMDQHAAAQQASLAKRLAPR